MERSRPRGRANPQVTLPAAGVGEAFGAVAPVWIGPPPDWNEWDWILLSLRTEGTARFAVVMGANAGRGSYFDLDSAGRILVLPRFAQLVGRSRGGVAVRCNVWAEVCSAPQQQMGVAEELALNLASGGTVNIDIPQQGSLETWVGSSGALTVQVAGASPTGAWPVAANDTRDIGPFRSGDGPLVLTNTGPAALNARVGFVVPIP